MSGYGQAMGYVNTSKGIGINPARKIRKQKVKLTLKQRFRNWLNRDDDEADHVIAQDIEPARLDSDGMRLQIYKASGGFVVETRSYDRRTDRHHNTMHVITEGEDLGEKLGKIIMMEALRG